MVLLQCDGVMVLNCCSVIVWKSYTVQCDSVIVLNC